LHILTAAHCVDVAGGERPGGGQTGDGTADYAPGEVNVIFNQDGDYTNIYRGVAAIDVHPDWHGFNNALAPGGASINDDIAVLTLNQPVPTGVPVYPLHFEAFDSAEQIVLAGYGTTGDGVNGHLSAMARPWGTTSR